MRPLIILFFIIMLLITSVSGTIAWLKSESNTLFDIFTYGDINIEITLPTNNFLNCISLAIIAF